MQRRFNSETRKGLLLSLFILGLVTVLTILPTQFRSSAGSEKGLIKRTVSADPALPNFDIREQQTKEVSTAFAGYRQASGKDASIVADVKDNFVKGENDLRARVPSLKIDYSPDLKAPEVIGPDVDKGRAFMTGATRPAGEKHADVLVNFLKANNNLIGATQAQLDDLVVAADYTNPDGNLSWVELNQKINGVPVFRGEIKAGFTQSGQLIRVLNNFAPGLDYNTVSTDFGQPEAAVRYAAANIHHDLKLEEQTINAGESTDLKAVFGSGDWATTAEKMYFPTEPGIVVPAYRVLIWEPVNAFYVVVDANTGTALWRKNITNDQTQTATYNVYNNPANMLNASKNPAPLVPAIVDPGLGTQGAVIPRNDVTLIGNEGPLSFNNLGWIPDGANTTDGNAVQAGLDIDGVNGVDAPVTGTARTFSFAYNPAPGNPAPGEAPTLPAYRNGAVTQLFYLNNRYHDALYQLGFTEAARNFQNDNFGRGGAAADRVSAEAQDSSGTNNANFATPADGGRGRMQMYVFTGPTPDYDGDIDADIVIHEHSHGLSNRLIGNGSGLGNNRGGSMGEGWGDFYGYSLLSNPATPALSNNTTGDWATYLLTATYTFNYYYGIRRFPYALKAFTGGPNNRSHNPVTFADIDAAQANLSDGAYAGNPVFVPNGATEVHNAGDVWCQILVEARGRFVARLGAAAGNLKMLQLTTDGMKLTPSSPNFTSARDAIIAAAAAAPAAPDASADVVDVREGFRIRGMGFGSSEPTATTVIESFQSPNVVMTNPFSVSDSPGNNNGVPEPGENLLLSVAVINGTGATVNNVFANVDGGANVSYGNIADATTVTRNIPYTVSPAALCGSTITVTINVTSDLGAQAPTTRSFVLGNPNGTTQNFDGVVAPALPAGWTTDLAGTGPALWATTATGPSSAPNSAFSNDPATLGEASLYSPVTPITSASAKVKFKNKYVTESTFDGMVLEIKIGAGAYTDIVTAGGSFVTGGYNATISTGFSSPIAGRQAWSGTSAGGYIDTEANLPAAANGQSVQLRWRMASDVSVAATGVNIDDVQIINGYTCVAVTPRSRADFDGDGKTDLSVFRPSEGNWYMQRSTAGLNVINWGLATDTIIPGDYDGDGKTDTAVFRPDAAPANPDYLILKSNGFVFQGVSWGIPADVAVSGDYDGDGKTDLATFRPSTGTWYILNSNGGSNTVAPFGLTGDVPVSIDDDGDGKTNLAVYRPSTFTWYIAKPTGTPATNFSAYPFGLAGDILAQADYDGDNRDDIAVFRPSNGTWYIRKASDGTTLVQAFGLSGDVPVPGDYDGDGKDDIAVYRAGTWYVNRSTAGFLVAPFGIATDIPVPVRYLPAAPAGGGGGGTTVSYTGPAVPITDNTPAGVNINVPVSGVGTVADLNFRFDTLSGATCDGTLSDTDCSISHSWVGDLIIKVTPPDGSPTVTIFDRPGVPGTTVGCNNNNIGDILLNDEGGFPSVDVQGNPTPTGCVTGNLFPTGSFSPINPLSALDGENANGTWVINVSDNAATDTGSVQRFSLVFNSGN